MPKKRAPRPRPQSPRIPRGAVNQAKRDKR